MVSSRSDILTSSLLEGVGSGLWRPGPRRTRRPTAPDLACSMNGEDHGNDAPRERPGEERAGGGQPGRLPPAAHLSGLDSYGTGLPLGVAALPALGGGNVSPGRHPGRGVPPAPWRLDAAVPGRRHAGACPEADHGDRPDRSVSRQPESDLPG